MNQHCFSICIAVILYQILLLFDSMAINLSIYCFILYLGPMDVLPRYFALIFYIHDVPETSHPPSPVTSNMIVEFSALGLILSA